MKIYEITGKAEDTRRGGYVLERVPLECTRLECSGGLTVWVRLNERRPSMTEASCAARLGSTRSRCGMLLLEVTCSDKTRLDEARQLVRRLAKRSVPVTTNSRWTPAKARALAWREPKPATDHAAGTPIHRG